MIKIYCDRCGREVDREESRIVSSFTTGDVARYMRRKLPLEMQQLAGKDFCRDCIADIVDFALNGKACDECVQQMMEEKGRNSMKENGSHVQYIITVEKIQDVMRAILKERQYQFGEYVIPLQPIDPELIQKYKRASQLSAGSGNEVEKPPE